MREKKDNIDRTLKELSKELQTEKEWRQRLEDDQVQDKETISKMNFEFTYLKRIANVSRGFFKQLNVAWILFLIPLPSKALQYEFKGSSKSNS